MSGGREDRRARPQPVLAFGRPAPAAAGGGPGVSGSLRQSRPCGGKARRQPSARVRQGRASPAADPTRPATRVPDRLPPAPDPPARRRARSGRGGGRNERRPPKSSAALAPMAPTCPSRRQVDRAGADAGRVSSETTSASGRVIGRPGPRRDLCKSLSEPDPKVPWSAFLGRIRDLPAASTPSKAQFLGHARRGVPGKRRGEPAPRTFGSGSRAQPQPCASACIGRAGRNARCRPAAPPAGRSIVVPRRTSVAKAPDRPRKSSAKPSARARQTGSHT